LAIPENASGKSLEFRTVQTYSNGQIIHWIDPSLTAEHPSPRINVTAKGGVIEDIAGDEAGPTAGETAGGQSTPIPSTATASTTVPGGTTPGTAVVKSSEGASKGLGIAALILGALGLLAGLTALALARRGTATLPS
jgi:uncharacterized protein